MKNSLRSIVFMAFVCTALAACSKKVVMESVWQPTALHVKDQDKAWTDSMLFDGDSRLFYSIKNDDKNLYITVRTIDEASQAKMMRMGFTLWIDTAGHKKHKIGIRYPLGQKMTPEDRKAMQEAPAVTRVDVRRRMLEREIKELVDMEIIGLRPEPVRTETQTPSGLAVSLSVDSNSFLIYKAVIPFKAIGFHNSAGQRVKSSKENYISLGFETTRPEPQQSQHNGDQNAGMNTGGGGMYRGGGMPGGAGMGRGGMNRGMSGQGGYQPGSTFFGNPIDFWTNISLARATK